MAWFSRKEKIRIKTSRQRDLLREKLKITREELGLSQIQVAAHLGREQSYVNRLETTKKRRITFIEVEQLAKLYNKPLDHFGTIDQVERHAPNLIVTVPDNVAAEYKRWRKTKRRRRR